MKHEVDAVYENGALRLPQHGTLPIAEGQWVRITIDDEIEPEAIRLAMSVYEGLTDAEIDEVEAVALDRRNFFASQDGD